MLALSENLVDDIMGLILSHLPAKSLVRFKAVSKPWCQLIESPQFIAMHYRTRATKSNNGCLLIQEKRVNDFCLVHYHLPTWDRLEFLNLSSTSGKYLSHCNGIICLVNPNDPDDIQLWNPAIRQFKTLPRSHKESPPNFHLHLFVLGLCFDPKSNGYKAVKVWVFQLKRSGWFHHKRIFLKNEVEVWTPGKDTWRGIDTKLEVWTPAEGKGTWRLIDSAPNVPLSCIYEPINLKGKLYWLAKYLKADVLVSFDMVREVFRVVPLPDGQYFDYSRATITTMRLAILNESMALFSNLLDDNKKCFEIWILNEENDQVSWSKYTTVELPTRRGPVTRSMKRVKQERMASKFRPLGLWNNGELFLCDDYGKLVFYKMSTGDLDDSGLEIYHTEAFCLYNESLVSINEW